MPLVYRGIVQTAEEERIHDRGHTAWGYNECREELKNRKEREREEIIKELREYIDKPIPWDEISEYTNRFELILDDEGFQVYCDAKTTEELKEELKYRKENKINIILAVLNGNINRLKELGYTIPYQDNTTIDSLGFNKVLDRIGVFYK